MRGVAVILGLALGCGVPKPAPPTAPTVPQSVRYGLVMERLPEFIDHGFIVSIGKNQGKGDALFFSGLALYGLPCAQGEPIAKAVETMLAGGTYYRFPGNTDTVTMDPLLALYWGLSARINSCGETARWAQVMKPAPKGTLPAGFDYVEQKLMAKLGLAAQPSASLQAKMEAVIVSWTEAVASSRSACYRINLGFTAMRAVEDLGGKISAPARSAFCDVSRGTRLATVENFCGRATYDSFLDGFNYNTWQYAHQRCPAWELPDGAGDEQPGIDFLVAYTDKSRTLIK